MEALMKYGLFLLTALAFSIPVAAGPLTFDEAKVRADSSESALSSPDIQKLVNAQGELASRAFQVCVQRTSSNPTDFTVVVQIDIRGSVVHSWREGESRFAQCFQEIMEKSFSYRPQAEPFFTAFEYTNEH